MRSLLQVQGLEGGVVVEGALLVGQCLLEMAPAGGESPIPHSCRSAACGTCRVRVLAGAEALTEPSDDETDVLGMYGLNAPRVRLACQARLAHAAQTVVVEVLEGPAVW